MGTITQVPRTVGAAASAAAGAVSATAVPTAPAPNPASAWRRLARSLMRAHYQGRDTEIRIPRPVKYPIRTHEVQCRSPCRPSSAATLTSSRCWARGRSAPKLLEAMVRTVAEKGYEAATVADAVKLARVSRGTFYELFDSKEACLAAGYRAGNEVLEERVSGRRATPPTGARNSGSGSAPTCRPLTTTPCSRGCTCWSGPTSAWNATRPCGASPGATARASPGQVGPSRPTMPCSFWRPGFMNSRVRGCARAEPTIDLEDVLVGCAVRLAGKEEQWT